MHMPHCSQSTWARWSGDVSAGMLGAMMEDAPRFWMPRRRRPCLRRTCGRSGNKGCSAGGRSRRQGPLLLLPVVLGFGVEAVGGAVLEGHVLQLALATGVADRAVERVVAEQKLQGGFAGLDDLRGFGLDDHALGDGVVQAVWSFGIFSMRTTHMRQAAWSEGLGS